MAHELSERYSKLVLAKLRSSLLLADDFVFNNNYEGSPATGSVRIPVRDDEVAVSDYDKFNGIQLAHCSTSYTTLLIDKDKAINELIDGYDAASASDNIIADRLESGAYALAKQIDTDGGNTLLAGSTPMNVGQLTVDNIYDTIIAIRTAMSKANVPNDGKRYLLVKPDAYKLILTSPKFLSETKFGDDLKTTGSISEIANFIVKEWNDDTANLVMLAGHPRYATRAMEFAVGVEVNDLEESGRYIGCCAVQGRSVYGHKVLRSEAIRAVYAPGSLTAVLSQGSTSGTITATVTDNNTGTDYAYKLNPSSRASYGVAKKEYNGTDLISGETQIAANEGDVIEIVNFSNSKVIMVTYLTVRKEDIKE